MRVAERQAPEQGCYTRRVRHERLGTRCVLRLEARKWLCKECGRGFRQRLEGILPGQQASEPLKREIFQAHRARHQPEQAGATSGIGSATVERWFQQQLRRLGAERKDAH